MKSSSAKSPKRFDLPIFIIRGQRVLLDVDLARVYAVTTKRINEAVKRNLDLFPNDFAFRLTYQEVADLRANATRADSQPADEEQINTMWSQSATSSPQPLVIQSLPKSDFAFDAKSRRSAAYRPWAFTEHGALMAANILRSPRAVQMSVYVVRAFVQQREQLMANAAIFKRLAEMDKTLLEHDDTLRVIWTQLQPLLNPPPDPPQPRIGFGA